MNKDQEQKLQSIEYHLQVAKDFNQPAIVLRHAQSDLLQTDIPYLLELVRTQALELQIQKTALKEIEDIVNTWRHGALISSSEGIIWKEPIDILPSNVDEILAQVKEGLPHE